MARSAAARAEARLKQLCCLDLGREAVIPALLVELRNVVPNLSSLAFFFNDKQALAGGYSDNPESAVTGPLYMQEFHGRRGRELGGAFPDSVRTQFGVHDYADALGAVEVDLNGFGRSDFYNLIYRPQRVHWFMRLMVREGGRGRALGCVTLYRGERERPWTADDKRRLAVLEPFFAQVLRAERKSDAVLTDSGRQGLIVADRTGKPIHLSREAKHLLHIATYPVVTPETDMARAGTLPAPLVQICRNLHRVFADDAAAAAPVYHHRNPWGGFRFEAQWLDGAEPDSGLIGIIVTHQEPVQLKLLRRIGDLPLSRRQAQVCFLMANGASNETIATRLGISKHTAIAHGRWIYDKLNLHNRAELASTLLR